MFGFILNRVLRSWHNFNVKSLVDPPAPQVKSANKTSYFVYVSIVLCKDTTPACDINDKNINIFLIFYYINSTSVLGGKNSIEMKVFFSSKEPISVEILGLTDIFE
jgi:hypothetical protein